MSKRYGEATDADLSRFRKRRNLNKARYLKDLVRWHRQGLSPNSIIRWLNSDEDEDYDYEGMNQYLMGDETDMKARKHLSDKELESEFVKEMVIPEVVPKYKKRDPDLIAKREKRVIDRRFGGDA